MKHDDCVLFETRPHWNGALLFKSWKGAIPRVGETDKTGQKKHRGQTAECKHTMFTPHSMYKVLRRKAASENQVNETNRAT